MRQCETNVILEDDDDDVVFTGQNDLNMQEVCYGHLVATVAAHLVPKPKIKSVFVMKDEWPSIKCNLERELGKNKKIKVIDPFGTYFGNVDAELSEVLAPAMDGFDNFRTQPRLLNRRKKKDSWPGQPCSDPIKMIINIYGPRKFVTAIGRHFGNANIYFKSPMVPDPGVPICNPHEKSLPPTFRVSDRGSRHRIESAGRTVEESNHDVTKLFDHFASDAASLSLTEAPPTVITPLLEHQKQALTFLLKQEKPRTFGTAEAENSSLWRLAKSSKGETVYKEVVTGVTTKAEPAEVYGGLLADVMGLGKTIEALALIASTVDEAEQFGREKLVRSGEEDSFFRSHTKATLLVAPLSAVKNWEDQILEHMKPGALMYCIYHGPNRTSNAFELSKYDVVVTTYGTVASEFSGRSSKGTVSPLRQLKWFRVVLDEAHTIRESRAAQSQAIFNLWAQRRWCLTGTPIQNRIDDLGSLTRFLRLFPYDTAAGFAQYIRIPAQSGDADFLKTLRVFVDSFTLRRLKDRVDLPKRQDLEVRLDFSPEEQKLHDFFKERAHVHIEELTEKSGEKKISGGIQHHVLRGIMTLRLISAHGRELLKEKDLQTMKGISATEAIDVDEEAKLPTLAKRAAYEHLQMMAEADLDNCRQCDKQLSGDSPQVEVEDAGDGTRCYVLPCYDVLCHDCFQPYRESFDGQSDASPVTCPFCQMTVACQYVPITGQGAESIDVVPDDAYPAAETEMGFYSGPHTKTKELLRDIQEMKAESVAFIENGETPLKCVVFSEFTSHLDLIQRALSDNNHSYVRIDGTMSLSKRRKVLDAFNDDDKVTILLASIKAAGQGLNLTAASRAFIMEPMWNPAAEEQAVDRIYRIGQRREVTIKRYHMARSIELKIMELKKKKQALADVSMNRNHKQLNKEKMRKQHMKDILSLFK
jgi:SNF2 family DNA or RNA helicase